MAPLPPENTPRWYLDYTTCGFQHTLQMRAIESVDAVAASAAFDAFLTSIDSQIYEMSVDGLRHSADGSNISLPETWAGATTYGDGDGPDDASAVYVDFVGRSTAGRRVRVAVFGGKNVSLGGDYRVSEADSSVVGDAITALTLDSDCWEAIDGLVVVWNRYFNIGVNAYWRNKIR